MSLKDRMKAYAREIGIDIIGVTDAAPFPEDEERLRRRGANGMRAPSDRGEPSQRAKPQSILPCARTIISVGLGYTDRCGRVDADKLDGARGLLSTYTRGRDYHLVLGEKLDALVEFLQQTVPDASFKTMVDNTPLLEKAAAARAGLGWIGKNGLLITESFGTFVFLGEILTDIELEPDAPHGGGCGACMKCVDACPTGALVEPHILNAPACLSCVTQTKGVVPTEHRDKLGNRLYGCDVCQEACPHNSRFVEREYTDPDGAAPRLDGVLRLSGKDFDEKYGDSSMAWRGIGTFQRNAVVALGNSGWQENVEILLDVVKDPRPEMRAHAVWALRNCREDECLEALKVACEKEKDLLVAEEFQNVTMRRI